MHAGLIACALISSPFFQAAAKPKKRSGGSRTANSGPGGRRHARPHRSDRQRRRRALSRQPGQRDFQDQRARPARPRQSRRSRQSRPVARRTREPRSRRRPRRRARVSSIRLSPLMQTVTGATVPEDRTKAEADVQADQQALDAAKKVYDSRVDLQKQGALAQKLVDDARVAMVQAQSQLDTAQRPSSGCPAGHRHGTAEGRAGAGECGQSPLRQRGRAGRLTRKSAAPSTASSPTGPSIPAKWPQPALRSSRSSISRRSSRAPTSR